MQEKSDEGGGGSTTTRTGTTGGILEDPHRVKLVADGWNGPIAWGPSVHLNYCLSSEQKEKRLDWLELRFEKLFFSKASSLLIVQGIMLQGLFPPNLVVLENGSSVCSEPFPTPPLFLFRQSDPIDYSKIPLSFRDVVLGVVLRVWGFTEDEQRATMVNNVTRS